MGFFITPENHPIHIRTLITLFCHMLWKKEPTRFLPRFMVTVSMFSEIEKVRNDLKLSFADMCRLSLEKFMEEYKTKTTQDNNSEK